jgi:hypothetical protein
MCQLTLYCLESRMMIMIVIVDSDDSNDDDDDDDDGDNNADDNYSDDHWDHQINTATTPIFEFIIIIIIIRITSTVTLYHSYTFNSAYIQIYPASANPIAALNPAPPAPTTTASYS